MRNKDDFKPYSDARRILEKRKKESEEDVWSVLIESAVDATKRMFEEMEKEEKKGPKAKISEEEIMSKTVQDSLRNMFKSLEEIESPMVQKLDQVHEKLDRIEERLERLEEVNQMQTVVVREISEEQAREEILDYLEEKEKAYPSDIAEDLNISLGLTLDVIHDLKEEEKLGEVEGD
ncbi:hypothetical protein AKJ51_00040 [candidate division MSBL1 archaeon SCGC-AAA382A20]|uniref:Uncharacterized protein n=1 Tax=candidate division MSBL1 archaeon SCGC-AAA382A20 TaxID=1698280 RepID=A0A133VMU3_9EURY|nr:hypothetical protein AKJ51_00040 [candidate division MSBL1 archaeon SCGC-AAA382A20]